MSKFIYFLKDWKKNKKYGAWLLEYVKPFLPKILLIMGIDILTTVFSTVMAILSKEVIDRATTGESIYGVLVAYAVFTISMLIMDAVGEMISLVMDEKFSFGIRKQVYEQIIHAYWMDAKRFHTGDLMTRLTSDAGNVSNGLIYTIPTIIRLVFDLLISFITLFIYQPLLAVFALAIAPVAAVVSLLLGRKLKKLQTKVQETEAAYRSFLQESMANLLIVKSFANEDYATDRLVKLRDERFKWVYKKGRMGIFSQLAISFSFNFAYIVAFSFGAIMVSTATITYGTMSLFLTLINRIQAPVVNLAQQIPKIVSIFASAERIVEIENMPLEEPEQVNMDTTQLGIQVRDLSFGYTADEMVLEHVSLDIKPGEFVAIIGESGIGKTTLIRLMMSFMSQYQGDIMFQNGQGETVGTNAGMRQFLSYVPQGNTLFSGTIRENIRMGKLDATEEEMIEALKMAAAYDFVMDLPQGIDTVIGERGHGISEGQAQRIAIARCLIRKAPFIILDEATSSLDSQTEIAVLQGLQQLTPKPTCVIITHRLSVLPYCDRQIKLEAGQLILAESKEWENEENI